MATQKPPFRPYLKPPRRGRAGARTLDDLRRVHAGDYRTDLAFLRHAALDAEEIVAWTLLQREGSSFREKRWASCEGPDAWLHSAAALLTERAQRDLDAEEGVFWTPLVDALAQYEAWDTEVASTELYTLSQELRYWLGDEPRPAEIDSLLAFSSDVPLSAVAEYATRLNWKQIERMLESDAAIEALSRNPDVTDRHAKKLVASGWEFLRGMNQDQDRFSFSPAWRKRRAWLVLFRSLLERGARLPDAARTWLVREAERPVSDAWDATYTEHNRSDVIAAVALDPDLTRDEVERLAALRPRATALHSMMRAREATLELHEEMLAARAGDIGEEVWCAFVERHQQLAGERLLRVAYDMEYPSNRLLKALITHPGADERVWLRLLQDYPGASRFAFEHEPCLANAAVRIRLVELADHSGQLAALLARAASGEEWRTCFRRLAELSPVDAARELAPERLPKDVELSRMDLLPLLTSDFTEARVAAMCALSEARQEEAPTLKVAGLGR